MEELTYKAKVAVIKVLSEILYADNIVRDPYHHYDKPYIFLRDVDVEPIVLESEEIFEKVDR